MQERAIVKIAEMVSPDVNVRMHPEKQIKEIIRSLNKFGQCRDIVLDEKNMVLAGNGLKEAMERRGDTEATAIRLLGLTEKEKYKFMLADNKTFTLGIEDHDGINAALEMLGTELDVPGYDEDTLRAIVASADEVTERLMTYGTLDQQQINSIHATGERMEVAANNNQRNDESDITAHTSHESSEPIEARRTIICPKCGEQIWV